MAGIRNSELRGYCSSEWKADVGYLVREFEIQKEIERSKVLFGSNVTSAETKNQFVHWLFGKRHTPRH
jgi:hypothetical protein